MLFPHDTKVDALAKAPLFSALSKQELGELAKASEDLEVEEGKVLTREEIYEQIWGYRMAHGDRSVDVFVRKVRQKLDKASPKWIYIHTHFGLGYRFEPASR